MTAVPDPALLDDYRALREGIGARRLDCDVLSVSGPDAAAYLQGQCSQDLDGLAVGRTADSLLLEPDGKLTALVRVVRLGDESYALTVDGGFGDAVAARLARFRLRSKVAIEPLDWPCVAVRGRGVAAALAATGEEDGAAGAGTPHVLPVDWNGTVGADLLGPGAEDAVPPGTWWCGDAAWAALRVEAGIPAMGRELDGRTIAAEAGLVARTVSFTKGCYTGQELVARLDARGNRVARRLCGVVVDPGRAGEHGDEAGGLAAGALADAELIVPSRDAPVGSVTSAAWCPGLGATAGLAYVHRSVVVPARVGIRTGGSGAGTVTEAEVRELPLVGS